jgi:hypothetical protein
MLSSQPFIFIVGCGRSGTTLLAALVDSHPAVGVPAESGGFILRFCLGPDAWAPHRSGGGDPERARSAIRPEPEPYDRQAAESLVGELRGEYRYGLWGLDDAAVVERLLTRGARSRPDVVRCVYESYAAMQGKALYGDKTPDHVVYLPTLALLFPEALFVHLIRDGRDVALAMRDTSWGPQDAAEAAKHWAGRVNRGAEAGAALGPQRYLELRYEALVTDPTAALGELCRFAGIDYDTAMLEHRGAAERQIAMSPSPEEDRRLRMPISAGLRDWRRQMPHSDVERFEEVAGATLRRFGY